MYGPWNIDPSDKKKSAMKMICLGEEQTVRRFYEVTMLVVYRSFCVLRDHFAYFRDASRVYKSCPFFCAFSADTLRWPYCIVVIFIVGLLFWGVFVPVIYGGRMHT